MQTITVGMTTISPDSPSQADAPRIPGPSVSLMYEPVNLSAMSIEGYDDAHQRLSGAALHLINRGASSVMVDGTSLTFYRGHAFHDQLLMRLEALTGTRVSSASRSLLNGLATLGARRLAIATAYTADVNERLRQFLQEVGYDVVVVTGMGISGIDEAHAVTPETVGDFARAVFASAPLADCLVISCGGLRTLDLIVPLEIDLHVPVVTSFTATIWGLACLAGVHPMKGFGQLLDGELVAP
jgi:arylmalonate decarboxylase